MKWQRSPDANRFHLGACAVDMVTGEVRKRGEVRRLEPRAAALLRALLAARGGPAQRDELVARVWGHPHVSKDALPVTVNRLRRALFDEQRQLIVTLPRTGYRLTARPRPVHPMQSLVPYAVALLCTFAAVLAVFHLRSDPAALRAGVAFAGVEYHGTRVEGAALAGTLERILLDALSRGSGAALLPDGATTASPPDRLSMSLFDDGAGWRLGARRVSSRGEAVETFVAFATTDAPAALVAVIADLELAPRFARDAEIAPWQGPAEVVRDTLRAEALFRGGGREGVRSAHALLREVLARAPEFAPAHLALAETTSHKDATWLGLTRAAAAARSQYHAQRAADLAPGSVAPRLVRANLLLFGEHDPQAAVDLLEPSLQLAPGHAGMRQTHAMALAALGRLPDADLALASAEARRPASAAILRDRALLSLLARDWPAATQALSTASALGGDRLHWLEAFIIEGQDGIAAAAPAWIEFLRHAGCGTPDGFETPAAAYRWMLHSRDRCVERERIPWHAAAWAYGAGNEERALASLCQAAAEGDVMLLWLANLPVFEALRGADVMQSLRDPVIVRKALRGTPPPPCVEVAATIAADESPTRPLRPAARG